MQRKGYPEVWSATADKTVAIVEALGWLWLSLLAGLAGAGLHWVARCLFCSAFAAALGRVLLGTAGCHWALQEGLPGSAQCCLWAILYPSTGLASPDWCYPSAIPWLSLGLSTG